MTKGVSQESPSSPEPGGTRLSTRVNRHWRRVGHSWRRLGSRRRLQVTSTAGLALGALLHAFAPEVARLIARYLEEWLTTRRG